MAEQHKYASLMSLVLDSVTFVIILIIIIQLYHSDDPYDYYV